MPQRVFKRKSTGKNIRNFQPESCTETREIKESNATANATNSDSLTLQVESTIPNRIFVGGIASHATEWDIRQKFSNYGSVRTAKIIRDHMGFSKGYGFVTFNSEEEAKKALEKGELILKGRKLNIAPAVRKQYHHPGTQIADETYPVENYSLPLSDEQRNNKKKNYSNFERPSEHHPPLINGGISYVCDRPISYCESGQYYGITEVSCAYGNPQMNLISYPTLVYVPQHAFHYSGATAPAYHIGGTVPEIVHLIPAPICCLNEQK